MTFGEVLHLCLDQRVQVSGLFGLFTCHWNRELLSQTEARMMHFVTLTVPPPRTNHSLMHNSTRGMSPSQKSLQVRFAKTLVSGHFRGLYHTIFSTRVNFFCNIPDVHRLLKEDILQSFHWFLECRVHVSGLFVRRCLKLARSVCYSPRQRPET
jgi:hypothetical protein